jgi:hypothetical protein
VWCLVVSAGDHDYVVPYTGTRAWVYDMKLQQSKPWRPWSLPGDDQVSLLLRLRLRLLQR